MPSLFSLFVDLKANTTDFVSGMSTASYAAKKFGRDAEDSFGSLGSVLQKALGPLGDVGSSIGESLAGVSQAVGSSLAAFSKLGTGAAGAGAELSAIAAIGAATSAAMATVGAASIGAAIAVAGFAIKGSEVVESLERMSEKTGIGVKDLQVLGAAGASVGVSLDDVVTGMRKFDQVITGTGTGSAVLGATLKGLGVTAKDNQGALLQLADAFSGMEDGPRKDALAVELLGRSGLNLIPVLDKGREGILEFQSIVEEFGPTITSSTVKATEDWKKSTLELDEAWKSFEVNLTNVALPALSKLTEWLAVATKAWGDFGAKVFPTSGTTLLGAIGAPTFALGDALVQSGKAYKQGFQNLFSGEPLGKAGTDQASAANSIAEAVAAAAQASVDKQKASYKGLFDFLSAGGQQQLQLQHLRENLAEAIALQDYKQAAAIQQQINALQQAVRLEQERQRLRQNVFDQAPRMELESPRLPSGFTKYPEPAVPDLKIGTPFGAPLDQSAADANAKASSQFDQMMADRHSGQAAVSEFWQSYGGEAANTLSRISAEYDDQKASWADMLSSNMITQREFDDISVQLEKNRLEAVVGMYDAQKQGAAKLDDLAIRDPWTSMGDKFKAFANQIELQGQDLGPKVFASMSKAVEDVSTQLAKFVVTGKSNFKQLFESLEESVAKAGFQKLFSEIAKPLSGVPLDPNQTGKTVGSTSVIGSLFNSKNAPGGTAGTFKGPLGLGAGAADGTSASPFYTIPVDAQGNALSGLDGKGAGSTSIISSLVNKPEASAAAANAGPFPDLLEQLGAPNIPGPSSDLSGSGLVTDFLSSVGVSTGIPNLPPPSSSPSSAFAGGLSSISSAIGSAVGGTAGSLVSGLGKLIEPIFSLFGGFLANGGDVTPGKAYVVGEKHPEFFVPRQAGQVVPSLKMSSGHTVNNHIYIQTPNPDAFSHSSGQIMATIQRQTQIALARNG